MPLVRYGEKPGVGAAFKIMVDEADDPWTTSNADWQKFVFNSEQATKMAYVYDIREISYSLTKWPRGGADHTDAIYYEPSGTNESTALEKIWTVRDDSSTGPGGTDGWQAHVIFPEKLGFSYTPIIEARDQTIADSRFLAANATYIPTNSLAGASCGFVQGQVSYTSWFRDNTELYLWGGYVINRRTFSLYGYFANPGQTNLSPVYRVTGEAQRSLVSVLELPAGNEPLPTYAGTPTAGQKSLMISTSQVRMAYPGHDINESSHEAFIFSESRIPAKVIGSGQTWVNTGANVKIFTKRPTTVGTYVDFIIKRPSEAQFHHPPYLPSGTSTSNRIYVNYVIEADGIRFYNTGDQQADIRYIVFADDDSPNTTGGSKVMRQANDGTVDYFQLKVPGSSDTAPNLNDIILDSRYPNIPIVDEGWLAASAFTETGDGFLGLYKKTVNFTNDGFMPFVKYMCTWNNGGIRAPFNRILRVFNTTRPGGAFWNNKPSGVSTNCRIFDNKLEFFHSSGNPNRLQIDNQLTGTEANPIYGETLVGIRWYLFAIPLSL
ncbi:hypothetical protein Amn_18900 [Aminobacter sp. Y103A]|uniref:hypothetical protein n=1 Tax=Aminobacter sp. Y103A TaxID=1870862 RepID=UPI0025745C76|nr:hypothetical protein [Aminobacter sp. SS-2016]BBD37010.1 hypothetical protein Amn_18900 [Aminobacter sp. SS-2016]